MLTFSFESNLKLIGCGVDGETRSRFSSHVGKLDPLPMVFSKKEIEHINKLPDPALGFCAAFCCKEAVFKAIAKPMNFLECELLYLPGEVLQRPLLSIDEESEISDCTVRFIFNQPEDLIAVVHLFGKR